MDLKGFSMPRWVVPALLAVAVFFLLRHGCGGLGIREGDEAKPFRADPARGGPAVTLASVQGRPFAVVFFATWCGSCREELPAVARVHAERRDLSILAVSDEAPATVKSYLDRARLDLDAYGGAGVMLGSYGIHALPSAVVVGADGRVAYAGEGGSAVGRALTRLVEMAGPP